MPSTRECRWRALVIPAAVICAAFVLVACSGAEEREGTSGEPHPVESEAGVLEEARTKLAGIAGRVREILAAMRAAGLDNATVRRVEGYLGVVEEQPVATRPAETGLPEDEHRSKPPDPGAVPDPVRRYAPVVYFHPDEWLYPIDAWIFLEQSTLMWAHDGCDPDAIAGGAGVERAGNLGALDPSRLGAGGYSHPAGCGHGGGSFDSAQLTRPHDDAEERPAALPLAEGFFLELEDAYRFGDPIARVTRDASGVPVYFEYEPRRFVTYWFLYGASASPVPDPRFDPEATILAHEGDWEHLSVRLDGNDEATHAFYASHRDGQELAWADVPKEKTHPVVYPAWGSHASYSRRGVFELDCPFPGACFYDFAEPSRTGWRTWEHLRPAREEPWYGFGGAWGTNWPTKDFSGALGPSAFKDPAPRGWLQRP